MKTYKCHIPRFEVEIKANGFEEAYEKALEIYKDFQDNDPMVGDIIVTAK
jgi:hypothetical protein